MLQKFLAAIVSEEWARIYYTTSVSTSLVERSILAKDMSSRILNWLQGKPPAAYHEMALSLSRIHVECTALLQSFALDCKLPMSAIPSLGAEIDITGTKLGGFTIDTAQAAVGALYTRLKDSLGKTRRKELSVISEKHSNTVASIERYTEVKGQHDVRVAATFAAAFVAFRSTPEKVSPVVKGIMNSIKVRYAIIYDRDDLSHALTRRPRKISVFKHALQQRLHLLSNFASSIIFRNLQIRL